MSYSFTVIGGTKDEVKQRLAEALDNVVNSQPNHKTDRDAAAACGNAFVDMLGSPGVGEHYTVNVFGSLSWRVTGGHSEYHSANVSVNASLVKKPA